MKKHATIILSDQIEAALETYRQRNDLPPDSGKVVQALVQECLIAHGYLMTAPTRRLRITPAEHGSGLTDVSVNHDRYLAEDVLERKTGGSR